MYWYMMATLLCYVGMRWRTEKEVVVGKGQFICGAKGCDEKAGLCSYEVDRSGTNPLLFPSRNQKLEFELFRSTLPT